MKPTLSTSTRKSITPFAQHLASALFIVTAVLSGNSFAQTAPPPNFGDETKGEPAIEETTQASSTDTASPEADATAEQVEGGISRATVVESRRESGQVYSIELQHSKAPNQYIEETDSDGNIEFQSNDQDEVPNLPKCAVRLKRKPMNVNASAFTK